MSESRPKLPNAPPKPPPSSGKLEIDAGPVSRPDAGLEEVEQAMSILGGRHPEFARAEREKAEAMARRRHELEIAERRARERARRSMIIGSVLAVVIGGGAWFARERFESGKRALASSAPLAQSFAPLGFVEVAPSPWGRADRLEVPLPSGTCAIALGADGGKPISIEVTHDGDTLEAQGSFGFCTCANEVVTVVAKGDGAAKSVRLLRTDARHFGSVLGFARAAIKPAAIDRCACMEDHLDGWLGSEASQTLKPADAAWLTAAPARASLARAGLHVVAGAPNDVPLFPLAVTAGTCAVAVPAEPSDTLALRTQGGVRPLDAAKGTLAVCSKSARTYGVWHEGRGAVTLLSVDATRVGGRSELGAVAQRGGLGAPRMWLEADDLPWDAGLALGAAHVAPVQTLELAPGAPLPADAHLIAFSLSSGGKLDQPAGDGIACERVPPGAPALFCVESAPTAWHEATGKARVGVAHAALPIWMKPLASNPPGSANALLSLVVLARKLGAQRYEPTVLEGVTETATGATILGRGGEDAIVAAAVQPSAPFVVPLGENGGWDLDGEPNVVALAPGKKIALRGRGSLAPEESRRTVVFRRAEGEPKK